jgi:hypothetical protein
LVRTVSPSVEEEGLAIAALSRDQYVLSITVVGGGTDGCSTPTLTGFHPSGATLVADIARSPVAPNSICAINSTVTFYVVLDRGIVWARVAQVALSDSCQSAPCPPPISVPKP